MGNTKGAVWRRTVGLISSWTERVKRTFLGESFRLFRRKVLVLLNCCETGVLDNFLEN